MLRKVTSCSELKNIFYRKAVACAASVIFSVLNNFFKVNFFEEMLLSKCFNSALRRNVVGFSANHRFNVSE